MGTWIEPYIKSIYDPKPFLDFLRVNLPINPNGGQTGPQGPEGPEGETGPQGPQGVPGSGGSTLISNEVPTGLINGSNATFTTAFDFEPGTVEAWLNGQKLTEGTDYVTTGTTTILLSISPNTGENLTVDYLTTISAILIVNEIPTGAINSINTTFTTANTFIVGTLEVYLNGIKQDLGIDYTAGTSSFVMNIPPQTGELLTVNYQT